MTNFHKSQFPAESRETNTSNMIDNVVNAVDEVKCGDLHDIAMDIGETVQKEAMEIGESVQQEAASASDSIVEVGREVVGDTVKAAKDVAGRTVEAAQDLAGSTVETVKSITDGSAFELDNWTTDDWFGLTFGLLTCAALVWTGWSVYTLSKDLKKKCRCRGECKCKGKN